MAELPTGTLTLLFSDIEGSTALLRRRGDRYGEALSAQRALLRACFAEYHGREMGTEGDSFFVVFQSAGAAVSPPAVYFVTLAAVRDAEVMWKTIADSLDVSGEESAASAVTGYLSGRQALLVLDNLEQLDGAAEVVGTLLAAVPSLLILATSRRPLHLQGEHEMPVLPLEVPGEDGVEEVTACGAARLFVQQADMARPGYAINASNAADIAAICRRLDGLPLAIELAASRVKLLAPHALLARLEHRLSLAAADTRRPSRQQTLRALIGWSYDLLAPELAGVFRRAGVFVGGCDLDALTAVAAAENGDPAGSDPLPLAAGLLDVSLITVTEGADGEPRVGMLETVREYARERLEQVGELDETRRRHAGYYAGFAERAHEQMFGPAQLAALDRLEAEHDNLRAALSWSLETGAADPAGDGERAVIGLRLVQALTAFWHQHGHATEGRRWLQRAMGPASAAPGEPLARVAHGLAMMLAQQGEMEAALPLFELSLGIWRELGNRDQQAKDLNSLGVTYGYVGNLDTARSMLEESIAVSREIGSDMRPAAALTNLGNLETSVGNLGRATEVLTGAIALDQKQGDLLGVAMDRHALAMASLRAGRALEARDLLSATFDFVASAGNADILATTLELSACVAAELGEGMRAARLAGAAEAVRLLAGMPILEFDAALLERFLAPARAAIARREWDAEYGAGRALTQQRRSRSSWHKAKHTTRLGDPRCHTRESDRA